jgi:hypothetical protein
MKKKTTAFVSVVLLVCSLLTMNASAATSSNLVGNKASLKVTGTCNVPKITISVVVPSSVKSYINPSKVSVKLAGYISDAQIVTDTAYIENKSTVPISVSASVTGAIKSGSNMTLATKSTTETPDSTAKKAFVFVQMQAVSDPDPSVVDWDETYDAEKHILVTTSTKSKTDFITLDKYDADAEADGDVAKRYGAFLMTGDCVMLPADPWTSKDGFTAQIAFTFKPLSYDTVVGEETEAD